MGTLQRENKSDQNLFPDAMLAMVATTFSQVWLWFIIRQFKCSRKQKRYSNSNCTQTSFFAFHQFDEVSHCFRHTNTPIRMTAYCCRFSRLAAREEKLTRKQRNLEPRRSHFVLFIILHAPHSTPVRVFLELLRACVCGLAHSHTTELARTHISVTVDTYYLNWIASQFE